MSRSTTATAGERAIRHSSATGGKRYVRDTRTQSRWRWAAVTATILSERNREEPS